MDKESIVDVLTADTDVFFACWDTDNGWQVLTNGNASFPAALFAQKGIEALRDVVAESDSRLCDNFLQEIDRGVESHNSEDVIKGNCRTGTYAYIRYAWRMYILSLKMQFYEKG